MHAKVLVAALAAPLLAGCARFESRWAAAPATVPGSIQGRWTGTWQNTNNTHSGPLRAVVTAKGAHGYDALFHAGWGRRTGSFHMPIRGTNEDGAFVFSGSRRIIGVKITTRGRIDGTRFDAIYGSRFDNGTFTLSRP
jgi:hypothetical protein